MTCSKRGVVSVSRNGGKIVHELRFKKRKENKYLARACTVHFSPGTSRRVPSGTAFFFLPTSHQIVLIRSSSPASFAIPIRSFRLTSRSPFLSPFHSRHGRCFHLLSRPPGRGSVAHLGSGTAGFHVRARRTGHQGLIPCPLLVGMPATLASHPLPGGMPNP